MAEEKIITSEPDDGSKFNADPKVKADRLEIVSALNGYWNEADINRKGGLNPRDDKWKENLDLYWNRHDFSKKANWQAKEVMPEVPSYVDRFAAALKEALVQTPEGFYTVSDPADADNDLANSIKKMVDVWLTRVGRNQMGQVLPFSAVFEEQMKMGALTACAAIVTWKEDTTPGRVAIEAVDPRFVWLDHTFRNLYRIRRIELDRHDLMKMAKARDGKGNPIFNLDEINNLLVSINIEDQARKEEMSGHGQQISTGRSPITVDEYIATVVNSRGEVLADRSLIVVANRQFLIRGPEANPFLHGNDWLVYTPLVNAPLSVYGRSYMEDFGGVAKTFIELTNMILDAVHTTSLKAFAVVPSMLANPGQLAEGIGPNKLFLLDEGYRAEDFAKALDMGTLPAESVKIWEAMKSELGEAAGQNEIGIGQFAPNSRTSATEVLETKQSSSALIRSVAQTVETRWLDPVLDLTWKTGLQHVSKSDKTMIAAVGEDLLGALVSRKRELITRPYTFQARGISALIQKANVLKSLLSIVSIISQNQLMAQEFLKEVSMEKLVKKLFELSNIDLSKFQLSQREQMIRSVTDPMQAAMANAGGASPAQGAMPTEMQGLTRTMGIGK